MKNSVFWGGTPGGAWLDPRVGGHGGRATAGRRAGMGV
jgi:hypothetical protein